MNNEYITGHQIERFIYEWFSRLDVHPPVEDMLHYVSDEALKMFMPERQFQHHEGFAEWYRGVARYRNQSHTVKALEFDAEQNTATVKMIVYWERTDAEGADPSLREGYYAAQTWSLERSPGNLGLSITMYEVDYFLKSISS